MTFRDVLDLGILPEGVTREYNSRRCKCDMGNLLEELFFGYCANSDRDADFAEAGVKLKATCIDRDQLPKWRYLKGSKCEPRIDKRTGNQYFYSERSMAFPDLLENPSRTILTGEGDTGASRFKHIIRCGSGRYRRLVPDELDVLQTFLMGWTDTGMTDGRRAFCMGNALVVGVPHLIGKALA